MSDPDKMKPENPLTEPSEADDESIIDLVDLVEEIEPTGTADFISPIEQNRFGADETIPVDEEPPAGLADLGKLTFDEEEDPSIDAGLFLETSSGETETPSLKEKLDWLFEPAEGEQTSSEAGDTPSEASNGAILEDAAFNEPFPDTKELLDAMSQRTAETDPSNEDEDIELIEIEDDEVDNEIVWFDDLDLDKAPPSPESTPEAAAASAPLLEVDADLFEETSAADVFAANLASGPPPGDSASALPAPREAFDAALPFAVPITNQEFPPSPMVEGSLALSDEQIDAAVERVIERRLGGTLESIVLRAIETAVSAEIQRLKTLLLEDDSGDRTP